MHCVAVYDRRVCRLECYDAMWLLNVVHTALTCMLFTAVSFTAGLGCTNTGVPASSLKPSSMTGGQQTLIEL